MGPPRNTLTMLVNRFDRILACSLRTICTLCFVGLLVLLSAVVFVRFVPVSSLGWSDEIVEWFFAWMVFLGAAVLWRDGEHFRVKWLEMRLEGKISGIWLGLAIEVLSMIFLAVMTYYGLALAIKAHDRSPILELPRHIWYLSVPLAGMIMLGYSLRNLTRYVLELTGVSSGEKGEIS